MSAVDKLIATAEAEVGYCEKASASNLDDKTANAGSANYTKYARDLDAEGDIYNGKKQGYAWCDVFVDWCFYSTFGKAAMMEMLYQSYSGAGAGCTYSAKYYKNNSAFYSSPEVGDQIFFTKDGGSTSYHTGIVYKVTSSKVYTIEGNTSSSSGVVANGGCVCQKSYSISYSKIMGYGRPKWNVVENDSATDVNYQAEVTVSSSLNVRSGPGTSYSIVTKLSNGTVVTVTKESNNFGYLSAYSGWASLSYLTKVSTSTSSSSTTTTSASTTTTTTTTTTITEEDEDMTLDTFTDLMQQYRATLQDNDCGSWSEEYRTWAIDNGLLVGNGEVDATTGQPNYMFEDLLTREQAVTLMKRLYDLIMSEVG